MRFTRLSHGAALLAIAIALGFAGCSGDRPSPIGIAAQMSQLDRLAMRLSSKFKRDLDKNDFSLYYIAVPPDTILLEVRYRPSMDQVLLRRIILAADENARGVARDQFGLIIKTQQDVRPVAIENQPAELVRIWNTLADLVGGGVESVLRYLR